MKPKIEPQSSPENWTTADSQSPGARALQRARLIEIALATGAIVACRGEGYHRCGDDPAERDAFAAAALAFRRGELPGPDLQFVVTELSWV